MTRGLFVTMASLLFLLATQAAAAPGDVRIWASKRSATTDGQVEVHATPAQVYAAITNYSRWTVLFSDVKSVAVKRGGPRDAEVRFTSRSMGHEVTIKFDNEPDRVVRFKLTDGPSGARARGEFVLEALGTERTRISGSLYMDVEGVAGWFVTDKRIRQTREKKLRADLADLGKAFPARSVSR